MCVGFKTDENALRSDIDKISLAPSKRRNNNERKEKAKNAARDRRTQESDYFEELEMMLPDWTPPPSSQQTTLDKTSIIRLSVANLKCQDVLNRGLLSPKIKDEISQDLDLLSCVNGFNLVLGSNQEVIFVSENVTNFIGLTQVELLGQDISDYVHPCDHQELKKLTPQQQATSKDESFEIFVRIKSTVTERGRMINLKQANYKSMKISGLARQMPESDMGGVTGTIFMGLVSHVLDREIQVDTCAGPTISKHSVDMKFLEASQWFSSVAGYNCTKLLGVSFFDLVHTLDLEPVLKAFKNLKEHGQCESPIFRMLCGGGGWCWVQTRACLTSSRRGSVKPHSITCATTPISEVMHAEEILALVQMSPAALQLPNKKPRKQSQDALKEDTLTQESYQKPASCAPTSVIVRRQQKPVNTTVVVERSGTPEPIAVTGSIFSKTFSQPQSEPEQTPTEPKTVTVELFDPKKEPEQLEENEEDFFEELFNNLGRIDNLEYLAPHAGEHCIPLMEKPTQQKSPIVMKNKNEVGFVPKRARPEPQVVTTALFSYQDQEPNFKPDTEMTSIPIVMKTVECPKKEPAEADFFDELFSNLDQIDHLDYITPAYGKNTTQIETVNLKDLVFLDDLANNVVTQNRVPEEKIPVNAFIDPGRNLMWANNEGLDKPQMSRMNSAGGLNQSCILENSINDLLRETSDSNAPPFYNSPATISMDNNAIEKCTQASQQKVIILVPKM